MIKKKLSSLFVIASFLAACGGSDTSPPGNASAPATPAPPAASPAPATSAADRAAVMRLYEATALHAQLAASPLYFIANDNGKPWTTGPCATGEGSLQSTLDGGPVTPGVALPTGSHSYAILFTNCRVDGLLGMDLSGTAVANYTTTDWKTVTASVRLESMRGTGLSFLSDLNDVTGEGSGTWTSTDGGSTYRYAPSRGSRLVNNLTSGVAVFQGGTHSVTQLTAPAGYSAAARVVFESIAITLNEVTYVLDGSLNAVFSPGSQGSYTGEVRITSEGMLVGRVYGDGSTQLKAELLRPLAPF
jgi:hypothetical protein